MDIYMYNSFLFLGNIFTHAIFYVTEQQDPIPSDTQIEQEIAQAKIQHISTSLNVLRGVKETLLYIKIKNKSHTQLSVVNENWSKFGRFTGYVDLLGL